MGRMMKEFFGSSDLVGLATVVTVAFFCFFAFVCYRTFCRGRKGRYDHVASLPLDDQDRVIIKTEKGATR